jgi:hypothetical protein
MPCGSKRKNWTRFARLALSLPMLAMLGGCGMLQKLGFLPTPTPLTATGVAPACETFERVCLRKEDRVTDGTLYKIIGNNVAGKAAGCWAECNKDAK